VNTIQRPEVRLKHSHIVKTTAKSATTLTKHLADAFNDIELSTTAVEQAFCALDDAATLVEATQEQARIAKAASIAIHTGNIPEHGDSQLVRAAKRAKSLADALERDISVEQEQLQDLAEVLEHQSEKATSNFARCVKRAEYLFGKFMADGRGDISAVSKSSIHAHPPAHWAPFDLDFEYSKGSRVLRGEEKRFPREDTDADTLHATMVSDVCTQTLAQHGRADAAKAATAKSTVAEQDEAHAAALAAEIKGS